MSKKSFLILKIGIVMALSAVVSVSINYGNWVLPISAMVVSFVVLYATKKKVKDIIEDERDYKIAGNAARHAMTIYSLTSAVAGIFLFIEGRENESLYVAGNVLLYSAMALVLIYSLLFKIYIKRDEDKS